MESLDESNNNNQVCTESFCMDNDDSKTIKCTKCKRAVHYLCTKLPMYQLRLFFTKNYRGYICINCVKVPDEFQETFKKQEENLIEQYKREVSACENIIKIQKENENKLINGIKKLHKQNKKEDQEKDLLKLMENKFEEFENKIKQALVKGSFQEGNKTTVNQGETNTNFAGIVKDSSKNHIFPEFRKILRDERIKEIEEEHQQDFRKTNFMVFGAVENKEVNGDGDFVQTLIKDVGVKANVKFVTRIGDRSAKRTRPIKVVLQSAHQRYLVIQGLINLKGNEVYEGISVTEDFTLFERSQIKEWSKKAQERNAKESDDSTFIWRVRGSPSRGLYLKRTEKKVAILSD